MVERRSILTFISGAGVGGLSVYGALTTRPSGYTVLSWSNQHDGDIFASTIIESRDGMVRSSEVVYDSQYRIAPTPRHRAVDTGIVSPGDYDVTVAIESADGTKESGPYTTGWTYSDTQRQHLLIRVLDDMTVEFEQN